jgi:hypothetical protein
LMSILFFVATARGRVVLRTERGLTHEKADVEP